MTAGFFTICTKSYLADARTLQKSISVFHPDLPFYLFLADEPDGYFDPNVEPFIVVQLHQLRYVDSIEKMKFYYTAFEFCCSLRPFAHEYLLEQTSLDAWLFLDTDIYVTSSLQPVLDVLNGCPILFSPHRLDVVDADDVDRHDLELLRYGAYNGGFLGIRRSESSQNFLKWFRERLIRHCRSSGVLMCDQKWLDLVPSFFPESEIFRHRGANVAYWNIHERVLSISPGGQLEVAGADLLFFHFSGWDLENPLCVTRYMPIDTGAYASAWQLLAERYRDTLLDNGYVVCRKWPYSFDNFTSGEKILPEMRQLYYDELIVGESMNQNPFSQPTKFISRNSNIERRSLKSVIGKFVKNLVVF